MSTLFSELCDFLNAIIRTQLLPFDILMADKRDRAIHLARFLGSVAFGKSSITTADRAKLFLEALCAQDDRVACVERLVSKQASLDALRRALRIDTSISSINQHIAAFLEYLSDPAIKQICGGQFLQDLLLIIADPPTLWNALIIAHNNFILNEKATQSFAWLLWELLSMPPNDNVEVMESAKSVTKSASLLQSSSHETRLFGYKIQHFLKAKASGANASPDSAGPGGRHDNDFADYRKIAIFPTADEFMSDSQPFYRPAKEISQAEPENRIGMHLDNQFRLLREDMLAELRDDVRIAIGKNKGRRSPVILERLRLAGTECGEPKKWKQCALKLHCGLGMEKFAKLSTAQRKTFLKSNPRSLKHQSFGCLLQGDQIVAFAILDRNEVGLLEDTPAITLKICGDDAFKTLLLALKRTTPVDYIQVDTPFFAYEPVLQCLQDMKDIPLAQFLLGTIPDEASQTVTVVDSAIIDRLRANGSPIIQCLFKTDQPIDLDQSQMDSLIAGLGQPVSLIQGPPGTGKSLIGALIAKALYEHTSETILVLSYTNHALDQFLEDLLDIGIPPQSVVRLGSKSTPRTAPLNLFERHRTAGYNKSRTQWEIVNNLENLVASCRAELSIGLKSYNQSGLSWTDILAYLEFSDDDDRFYPALLVPEEEDGMIRVGKDGKEIKADYLYDRWSRGEDAGIFKEQATEYPEIWAMDTKSRLEHVKRWTNTLLDEKASKIASLLSQYNKNQQRLAQLLGEKTSHTLQHMKVIGCTTTAAAKYATNIRNAAPGIVLVEEAGEILESHVLTALSSNTKQLILIGDHLQLRPKYCNYAISVEKGQGYDFNRSMFERLVLAGYPHTTLSKQHRMCPEISSLVRRLTYPSLRDADKTMNRPPVRGIRDRVVFFNHTFPEVDAEELADRRDVESKTSKSNLFEVDLVLKCIRYLGQQGYGTDKLVILTPYLGQLRLLRDQLMVTNDPVLNDLDSFDLVKAGLLSEAGANINKQPIKISTIDNYQGEESPLVIVSMVRSNAEGDIGFMFSPERLNVMLSRARDGLIMIGNMETFLKSRNADRAWTPFLHFMKESGHLYDGLPVRCEQHPHKKALLKTARDFGVECPDGGCSEPCGTQLSCGTHYCPSKCHQLYDHSKMECQALVQFVCSQKHRSLRPCSKSQAACAICADEDQQKEKIRKRNEQLDAKRDARRASYAFQLAENQAEIDHHKRILQDYREAEDSARALEQKKQDLANLKVTANNVKNQKRSSTKSQATPPPRNKAAVENEEAWSSAKKQWEHFKRYESASNEALDNLMNMIGLEDVKDKFLAIKMEVETAVRQGLDMSNKRFGASLLGNPGTGELSLFRFVYQYSSSIIDFLVGKTTVARLYAKFLTSVGALPGSEFVETTGAALANEGVLGCKKKLEDIQNNGGGSLFIDEAYQLSSGNTFGGTAVLDFILAEVENLTGKVVFILAGYNKQMEKFFAHNPGFSSRFPHELQFKDYEDDELMQILAHKMDKRYSNRMKIEDGPGGLFARIVARRVGRGRGREGFGNAREMENTLSKIASRQAVRITKERRAGGKPDDFLFKSADLLGPEPTEALKNSNAWTNLQSLIGLSTVKQTVNALLGTVQSNYQRELAEEPPVEYSLNKVFLGSPGTGKTTVAKMYGQILADLGFLSNGEVVVKNPSDFVGNVLGASESTTKGILASTLGKILLIDEAYGLFGALGESSTSDPYKTAVIDTIVAEVQSVPGDDRCVLLAGYKEQMEEMFQKVNPGLSRRFPLASAFVFQDFDDDEIAKIFDLKLRKMAFKTTDLGKRVAMDVLRRARNRPNFGNAGEVDILLDHAKARQQQRLNEGTSSDGHSFFEPIDFDKDFDRGERADTNVRLLFKGVVGCETIISQLEGYQNAARELKAMDMDPREEIPFNFLFRTGKTSTARKMGKVFYDMGFLANAEVVECSATELIGSYVGHTGPKVQKVLESALGRVLFLDEAYRLAGEGFAKEAMDEIVDCLTKLKYANKLIVILAGYDDEINRLMAQNPGLTSRFPEAIVFRGLEPMNCLELLIQLLKGRQIDMRKKKKDLDMSKLELPAPDFKKEILDQFSTLGRISNWANARDVQTIAKSIFSLLLKGGAIKNTIAIVTEDHVRTVLKSMIAERSQRQDAAKIQPSTPLSSLVSQMQTLQAVPPHKTATTSSFATKTVETMAPQRPAEEVPPPAPANDKKRDAGVSDAVWEQLERDKQAVQKAQEGFQELIKARINAEKNTKILQQKEQASEQALQQVIKQKKDQSVIEEAKRLREEARIRHEMERRAFAELERQRKAAEEENMKEAKAQRRLRTLGICPAGYRWIKQDGGYRCSAGAHFVTDEALGL
ncbi:MAG: hypothetical protein M1829_001484 [Trizodia sp. TS-e1964]|nr:MAG: hypothetical protein M1829_001484 [Trizodia sp. TS-e1964]